MHRGKRKMNTRRRRIAAAVALLVLYAAAVAYLFWALLEAAGGWNG